MLGHLDVDFSQFLDFYSQEDCYLLRHFDSKSLKKKYARSNILEKSYFYRIVDKGKQFASRGSFGMQCLHV